MATNGAEGYVRRAELHAVDGSQVTNPDEAVAYMQARDNRAVRGCLAEISRDVAGIPGAEWQVTDTGRLLISDLLMSEAEGTLSTDGLVALGSLLEEAGATYSPANLGSVAARCAAAARAATVQSIPVYRSDGVTIIGEFEIG